MEQKLGHYSFVGGVVIAVVLGLASSYLGAQATTWLASLLVVLGLIAGFLNVGNKFVIQKRRLRIPFCFRNLAYKFCFFR